jgi:hypothetical protein
MRPRHDAVVVVDEIELKLGPLLGEAAPVDVEHVPVVVVLGQRVASPLPARAEQVGTLGDRHDVHLARVKQSPASGERAVDDGAPRVDEPSR